MRRLPTFALSAAWGTFCGACFGALGTREAALHLLAKNRALEAIGVPSLPGPSHWTVLSSALPSGAGALFFGLSLGLGWGFLAALWVRLWRRERQGIWRWLSWVSVGVALPPLFGGDAALAATLLAVTIGACLLPCAPPSRAPMTVIGCSLLVALGLLPWARAQEGPFSRLRDRVLLSTSAGLAVNEFYYRWTLYPAEVLKPLGAMSQPTVTPINTLPELALGQFCADAKLHRAFCVNSAAGADARLENVDGRLALSSDRLQTTWPSDRAEQRKAWQEFCRGADRTGFVRRATALGLFVGCPLALLAALGSLCARGGARIMPRRPTAAGLLFAAIVSATVFGTGLAQPAGEALRADALSSPLGRTEALQRAARSTRPVDRLYAVRAATDLGSEGRSLLLAALDDPIVNVRYSAAEALGAAGGEEAKSRLLAILRGSDEWYVKERAYAALWRLGWRPQ